MNEKELISLDKVHIPRWNELPNVDLYLDQIVTFINSSFAVFLDLGDAKEADKKENQILTKTMINNYVKNNLIDAPVKKKYSKIQCAKIFVICILKQVYSMNDIAKLINIATKHTSLEDAYNKFCMQFEQALYCTYNKEDLPPMESTEENKYLLKTVLLSCAYKLYVQNIIK